MAIFNCRVCGHDTYSVQNFKTDVGGYFKFSKIYECDNCGVYFNNPEKFTIPQIKFKKLVEDAIIPTKAHGHHDAAYDMYALHDAILPPHSTVLIKSGIALDLPNNYMALICSRSGYALKHTIFVANAPGIIDASYKLDIGTPLHNSSNNEFIINKGDRVSQMLIVPNMPYQLIETDILSESCRNGGFGSTGK